MITHFKFQSILISFSICAIGCGDLKLGMQYERILLAQKESVRVYYYSVDWARDGVASFISLNEDVCLGFDSTKDYCYERGYQTIYFKFSEDTLRIFSYGSKPTIPASSGFNISLTLLDFNSLAEYEKKYKNNEIRKVEFDSIMELPCSLANPPINPNNIKFK